MLENADYSLDISPTDEERKKKETLLFTELFNICAVEREKQELN